MFMEYNDGVIIDLEDVITYSNNHLPNSINIPYDKLMFNYKEYLDKNKKYYLGGYSLAGLFSLWACCQSGKFAGIAAASPSVWFPGFLTYLEENEVKSPCIYLSLGDKEEKT